MKLLENKKFLLKPSFFIISLCFATYFVLWIEKLKPSDLGSYKNMFIKEVVIKKSDFYPLRKVSGKLSKTEMEYAQIAWKYFLNNYNKKNGLINGRDGVPVFSFQDLTSYFMGLISAYELKIIDKKEFDLRLEKGLSSLKKLPLYQGKLPNKEYSTADLTMLDGQNFPSDKGVGWSALDIGRFFTFVKKIMVDYPEHFPLVKSIVGQWRLEDMIVNGNLYGSINVFSSSGKKQEGLLGFEEYAAKGLMMSGYDVSEAMMYSDFIKFVSIYDVEVGVDTRELKDSSDANYVLSDPYILDGIEYGWDVNSKELAKRIFNVQKNRYSRTNIITAVGEDCVAVPPYFVHNSIYVDGNIWTCVDDKGNNMEDLKTISTKVAFGWHVLMEDDYADLLIGAVKDLNDPEKGWYSGKFEKSGKPNTTITAITNGTILEALNYKANGRVVKL